MDGRARIWVPILLLAALTALVAVPASGAGPAGSSPAGGPPTASTSAKKKCNRPQAPGQITVPLVSAGVDRPFLLHVPSGYNGRKPIPLVLNLHPSNGNNQAQMDVSQMGPAADRNRVAVAAPNGAVVQGPSSYSWNIPGVPLTTGTFPPEGTPNDELYLLDVIRAAGRTVCIDPDRVYLTGYSGGARMASQMACDYSKKIAAIAPVAGLRAGVPQETSPDVWAPSLGTCSPKHPVSVLTFHGTADGTNPYLGNDEPRWGYSVEAALARWAEIDDCKQSASDQTTPSATLITHSRCESRSSVGLYESTGAGHTWPGSAGGADVDASIDATQLMLSFFKKHSLEQRK